MLALTSKADGTGTVEPLARFTTNPAGAAIVNTVGPIRQIVDPAAGTPDVRRYLTVMTTGDSGSGRVVQVQQATAPPSSAP